MIYIDDSIFDHPKIVQAGHLIGGNEGRLIALGLFVRAIAYARHQLTDGDVPVPVLSQWDKRGTWKMSPCDALVRVGLLTRDKAGTKGGTSTGTYHVHDFLKWNKTAAQLKEEQQLERDRKAKWRAAKASKRLNVPPVVPEVSQRDTDVCPVDVPLFHVPPSPYHDPLKNVQNSGTAATLDSAAYVPAFPKPSQSKQPAEDGNYRVILKLAHAVMEETGIGDPNSPDLIEDLKRACAKNHIDYGRHPDVDHGVVHRALEAAAIQRTLVPVTKGAGASSASVGALANDLRGGDPATLGTRIKRMAEKRRG